MQISAAETAGDRLSPTRSEQVTGILGNVGLGSRPAVAFANFDFCYRSGSGRPRSHMHRSGGQSGLTVPEVHRQHPERRDQDSLRLLLPHRPSTPALPNRPLAHAPLQADDMPDA